MRTERKVVAASREVVKEIDAGRVSPDDWLGITAVAADVIEKEEPRPAGDLDPFSMLVGASAFGALSEVARREKRENPSPT